MMCAMPDGPLSDHQVRGVIVAEQTRPREPVYAVAVTWDAFTDNVHYTWLNLHVDGAVLGADTFTSVDMSHGAWLVLPTPGSTSLIVANTRVPCDAAQAVNLMVAAGMRARRRLRAYGAEVTGHTSPPRHPELAPTSPENTYRWGVAVQQAWSWWLAGVRGVQQQSPGAMSERVADWPGDVLARAPEWTDPPIRPGY